MGFNTQPVVNEIIQSTQLPIFLYIPDPEHRSVLPTQKV